MRAATSISVYLQKRQLKNCTDKYFIQFYLIHIEDKYNYDEKSEGAALGVTRKLTVRSGDVEHAGERPPSRVSLSGTGDLVRKCKYSKEIRKYNDSNKSSIQAPS